MREPPKVSNVEAFIIYCFTGIIDVVKFFLGIIPLVDLIGSGLAIAGFLILLTYLFIRLGPKVMFGGRKGSQKMLTVLAAAFLEGIPALDDFAPLTLFAWKMLDYAKQEHTEYLKKTTAVTSFARGGGASRRGRAILSP